VHASIQAGVAPALVDSQHDIGGLHMLAPHWTPVAPWSPPEELELLELEELLPLLELEDELEEDLPLLELEEDKVPPPPVTVRAVSVGRPLPVPQKPKDTEPLAAIASS
jgi:hypothetical protein